MTKLWIFIAVMLVIGCDADFNELRKKGYQKIDFFPLALKVPCVFEQDTIYCEDYKKTYKYSCNTNEFTYEFEAGIYTESRYKNAGWKEKLEWKTRVLRYEKIKYEDVFVDSKYHGIIYYFEKWKKSEVLFVGDSVTYGILIGGEKNETMKKLESIVESAKILD